MKDQNDILDENEKLTAKVAAYEETIKIATENIAKLTADLAAANEKLALLEANGESARNSIAVISQERDAAVTERNVIKAENEKLSADMEDFNRKVAAKVAELGISKTAVSAPPVPASVKLTATEKVLEARGVTSLNDLGKKL